MGFLACGFGFFLGDTVQDLLGFSPIALESHHHRDLVPNVLEATSEKAHRGVEEASQKFLISYSKLTPTVYTSVGDSGIVLTIRYLCMPRGRRGSTQTIWERVLDAFGECDDIDFAYPTQRLYNNVSEGKPGARAPGSEALEFPGRSEHR